MLYIVSMDNITKGANGTRETITLLSSRIHAAATNSLKDPDALTPKQEVFCQQVCEGVLKYKAARAAGFQGSDAVLSVTAAKLLGQQKIKSRILAIQGMGTTAVKLTRERHLATLGELRDLARNTGQFAAAIRAEELRGKIAGLHKDDDDQQRAIADRVAKLPVTEQLGLVKAALARIQVLTGSRIEVKVDRPIVDKEIIPERVHVEPELTPFGDGRDFSSIEDDPIGLDMRRVEKDEGEK